MEKEYYKKLDIIRILSCFAVLLYHLKLLKGGYLAVCIFFAMTGYLSIKTSYQKENFSLGKYYLKRLKKIYLPLLIVVFLTIGVISLIPSINYLNMKREVLSILFGYNNYWQLNANQDYFVRNASSPFTHLWYIAILIQFEIIFPFIYIVLKKLEEKISKLVPLTLTLVGGILSYILFIIILKSNLMDAYYGTFTRLFSILFGVFLGLFHVYFRSLVIKNNRINNVLFYLYILILCGLFIFIDIKLSISSIMMLVTTIITLRLIDFSVSEKDNTKNLLIKGIADMSYEIYLVQYPVIFIFQYINISTFIKIPLIIIITFIISFFIHKMTILKKNNKVFYIFYLVILLFTLFGTYKYIIAKDNTKEINKLKSDLSKNQEIMRQKQIEYLKNKQKEEDEWNTLLSDLDNDGEALKEKVKNMHIVGVGDSIMELALKDLYEVFPNGYFDAVENRTARQTNDILLDIKNKGALADVVVFSIGTNGEFYDSYTEPIMETLGDRTVFWINATNADYPTFNGQLDELAARHSNIHIIDWVSVANEHPEYLISDKVHPTVRGCKVYANYIYESIYNTYKAELNKQKEQKIKEKEQQDNKKITFVGNDLLLGIYDNLEEDYNDSEFIVVKDNTYNSLKKELESNSINHNIVLLLDNEFKITNNNLKDLVNTYKDNMIYVIDINNNFNLKKDNLKLLSLKEYDTVDGIHLDKNSNKKLLKLIEQNITKE